MIYRIPTSFFSGYMGMQEGITLFAETHDFGQTPLVTITVNTKFTHLTPQGARYMSEVLLKASDEADEKHRTLDGFTKEADKPLIKAAPELLAALKATLNVIEGEGLPGDYSAERALIARAEGKS